MENFLIGLEVGWGGEPSALAILKRQSGRDGPCFYTLLLLERLGPGMAYPKIVDAVVELCRRPALHPTIDRVGWEGSRQVVRIERGAPPRLIVNASGVGRALFDMLARSRPAASLEALTIIDGTEGSEGRWEGTGATSYRTPRAQLVATALGLLESGRLKSPAGLPLADDLTRGLRSFRARPVQAANRGEMAPPAHGGLVLAVAVAAWVGERPSRALQVGPNPIAGYRGLA